MCGIIGIIGNKNVTHTTLECLQKLEYRGYDSAGISIISENKIKTLKSVGKVENLIKKYENHNPIIQGNIAIGHTRWATHGIVNQANTHPHVSGDFAIVHNGVIENYNELLNFTKKHNLPRISNTDSELIVLIIEYYVVQKKLSPLQALKKTTTQIKGQYAIAALVNHNKKQSIIISAKNSSMYVAESESGLYCSSDIQSFSLIANSYRIIDQGICVELLQNNEIQCFDNNLLPISIEPVPIDKLYHQPKKQPEHSSYFLQEVYEQPKFISLSLEKYWQKNTERFNLIDNESLQKILSTRILYVSASGSSYYAAMLFKYWVEKFSDITIELNFSSEYASKKYLKKDQVSFFISQSGETADTLQSMIYAQKYGHWSVSLTNNPHSTIALKSNLNLNTYAGIEISVASTKTFLTQQIALATLVLQIAESEKSVNQGQLLTYYKHFNYLPNDLESLLQQKIDYLKIAQKISQANITLYVGRDTCYPLALEGALKIKELSYINANAITAGELKHGTFALIDKNTYIIIFATKYSPAYQKTLININELIARNANILLITDTVFEIDKTQQTNIDTIFLPAKDEFSFALLSSIPNQLIAYNTAKLVGKDIDHPRNLAKSVTVE